MMDSKELAHRMDCVIGDMGRLVDELKGKPGRLGSYIDPVCWNCGKAYKFYLPDAEIPSYSSCDIWERSRRCAFEPRER